MKVGQQGIRVVDAVEAGVVVSKYTPAQMEALAFQHPACLPDWCFGGGVVLETGGGGVGVSMSPEMRKLLGGGDQPALRVDEEDDFLPSDQDY